jgi:hypothetical protein
MNNYDKNPNQREEEIVLLIEKVTSSTTEDEPCNPILKAPQRRSNSLSAQTIRFLTE